MCVIVVVTDSYAGGLQQCLHMLLCVRSRGFGFITYDSIESVDRALSDMPHIIDSRQVDPKRATPREVCRLLRQFRHKNLYC